MRNRGVLNVTLLLSLLVAGCGAVDGDEVANAEPTKVVRGYGLRIELPAGWWGDIARPQPPGALTLRAANFALPQMPTDVGHQAQETMRPDDILITLVHYGRAHDDWRMRRIGPPLAIERADLTSFEGFTRPVASDSFILDDQAFQLWVAFGIETPADELLADANRVLASIALEARPLGVRDLRVQLPVRWDGFSKRLGPDDENPAVYAANVLWPDDGQNLEQAASRALFERLPPDGVVISAVTGRNVEPGARAFQLPITLDDGYFLGDEGQPAPRVSTQLIFGRVGRRYLNVQVFFGRNRPTEAMRDEANAVLATLSVIAT